MPVDWDEFEAVEDEFEPVQSNVDWSEFEPVMSIPGSVPPKPPASIPIPSMAGVNFNATSPEAVATSTAERESLTRAGLEFEKQVAANRGRMAELAEKGIDFIEQPLVDPGYVRQSMVPPGIPVPQKIEGALQAVSELGAGLTSPVNLGIAAATGGAGMLGGLARAAVPRGVALGFGADMLRHAPEAVAEATKVVQDPNASELAKSKASLGALGQTAMGVGLPVVGLRGVTTTPGLKSGKAATPKPTAIIEEAIAKAEADLPKSAEALKEVEQAPEQLKPASKSNGLVDLLGNGVDVDYATEMGRKWTPETEKLQADATRAELEAQSAPKGSEGEATRTRATKLRILADKAAADETAPGQYAKQVRREKRKFERDSESDGSFSTDKHKQALAEFEDIIRKHEDAADEMVYHKVKRLKENALKEVEVETKTPGKQPASGRVAGSGEITPAEPQPRAQETAAPIAEVKLAAPEAAVAQPETVAEVVPQTWRVNVNTAKRKNVVKTVEASSESEAETLAAKLTGVKSVQKGTARLLEPKTPEAPQASNIVAPEAKAAEVPMTPGAPVTPSAPVERVRVGKSPQPFTVLERMEQSATEKAQGEQPVRVRNEKTGEELTVLESDTKPIKAGASPSATPIDPVVFTPEALPTPATKRLGITPAPELTGILRFIDDAKKYIRRKGTSSRGLPEPAYAAEQAMRGQIGAAEKSIKQTTRDLKRALADVYQLSKVEVLRDDYRRIPVEAREAMDAYLKSEAANPEAIPASVRGVLDNMRAEITGLSENIIGALEKAGGNDKLIDTIRNNMDVYVNRSYRFFDSKRPAETWYYDLDAVTRRKAEEFIISGEAAAGKAMAPEQARSLLLNWLSDLKDSKGLGASRLGAKDLSQFMRRKEIAPEIKAILGEYKDPLINYAKSVTKMTDWLANQRFLSTVRDAGMGKWLFPDESAPPGFNERIASEGSETMSPLNGLRTTPEIAEVFKSFGASPRDFGVVVRTYLKLNAITKIAATTQSLLTQMRNLGSQPWFWGMNGHWRLGELGPTLKAVAEDLGVTKGAPKGQWREYLQDAARHGIVGDTARAAELREIIRDAAFEQSTPDGISDYSTARLIKRFSYKIPGDVYKLSDELGKIYGWENEKALVRKVHPEWTDAQVKQEAATRVRDGYPTYSKTPEAVRAFRHLPVGPFVSFPYEILRTSAKAIGRSIQEIRSENPIERQIGRKRGASQVATLGSGFALSALSKSIWDITQQEEDDLRRFLPPWAKNSQLLYLGKQDDGKLKFLNLSYQNPYSYMVDPVVAAMASANTDEPFIEATARTTAEFFAPYISEQMLANAMLDVSRNTTETGRQIYNPQDDISTKAIKVIDHVGMTLTPGTVQRARRRIIPSFSDEQPDFGRKLSPGIEVGAELTGLRLEQFDFKTGLGYKTRQFLKDANNAEGIFRSLVNTSGSVSPEDVVQGFETAQSRRFELWSDLRRDYLAAMRSGVPKNDARKTLTSMGLSQTLTLSVEKGVYVPWIPGKETFERMTERRKGVDPKRLIEIAKKYQSRTLPDGTQ